MLEDELEREGISKTKSKLEDIIFEDVAIDVEGIVSVIVSDEGMN